MGLLGAFRDQREVHVWFVELEASAASVEAGRRSLSTDEFERASRFRSERVGTAFTLSRGILRVLLGRYLAVEPNCIRLAYGSRGKPRISFPETPLEFNLAHSGRLTTYAFAVGCELGVDIEEVRPIPDQEDIVRRLFSREEYEEWLGLGLSQRDAAFFRYWTRKEAYIKALGDGLSVPLDSFRVSLWPGVPASPIHAAEGPAATSKWSLCSLAPVAGYIGALAFPERGCTVRTLPRLTADAVCELARGPGPFPPASSDTEGR
jgi:4'-phosphopantetheinyl transferase